MCSAKAKKRPGTGLPVLLGLNNVGRLFACFYADDGLLAARKLGHLQLAYSLLIALFYNVGLQTNTLKTDSMLFLPGRIRTCLSDQAYCSMMDILQRGFTKGLQAYQAVFILRITSSVAS